MDRFGPEISDVVVDYDPLTLERRDVSVAEVQARLAGMPWSARRIARRLATCGALLDRDAIDGVLIRSHLELQRLHEEFRIGPVVQQLLLPVLSILRRSHAGTIRVVDLGCGLGYITRWLARHGALGDDVELVGADYNRALVTAAQRLADEDALRCRFVVGNAFALREPAHVVMSTGVLHHFRGDALGAVFREHQRAGIAAFVHVDIRPSFIAPLGSWIFHAARMREPLARFDGYWSTVRAHPAPALIAAIHGASADYATATIDTRPGLAALMRIFQAVVGVRASPDALASAFAPLGNRFTAT